jgi:phage tail tape-measure protein
MALKLEILLEAIDRISGPVSRMRASLSTLGRSAGFERLAAGFQQVGAGAAQTAGRIAALGAGLTAAAYGFNRLFIRGAADMERFRIMLARTEGGAAAAERMLGRLRDMADVSPFSDAETVEGFIRLRDLNLTEPLRALETLGDAAAGRFRTLPEAVEAFGAALRGEFDPLEQYGIQTRIVGDNIVATWTTATGQVMRLVERQEDRARVAAGLLRALGSRYAGAQRDMSRSWDGMVSNLGATWSRFTTQVMEAGAFNWLRGRLEGLLSLTGRMQRDGSMQTWAQATSAALIRVFEATERVLLGEQRVIGTADGGGPIVERTGGLFERLGSMLDRAGAAFERVRGVLRPIIGDFDALDAAVAGLAGITFAPLIVALTALGVALATTPAGLAITALGALAAAGLAISNNWGGVGDMFSGIERRATSLIQTLERLLGLTREEGATPRLQPNGGGRILQNLRPMNFAPPTGALGGVTGGGERLSGHIEVRVTDERVQVRGRSETPGVNLDVDQGLLARIG